MRSIAVLLCLLLPMLTHAQTFLDDGNVWSYATIGTYDANHSGNAIACDFEYVKYYLNGEEIINGKVYKKIYADIIGYITEPHYLYSPDDNYFYTSKGNHVISLREQEGIVYVDTETYINSFVKHSVLGASFADKVLTKVDKEYILYDFNVEASDSILPNIGNLYSLIYPSAWFLPMEFLQNDAIYRSTHLNLFYRDGKLEYKSPDFYPDPFFPEETADGIEEIVNGKWSNSKSIYNLQGQRIKTLQKGLNIVDGRKVWAK